jgi:hypothetical protein
MEDVENMSDENCIYNVRLCLCASLVYIEISTWRMMASCAASITEDACKLCTKHHKVVYYRQDFTNEGSKCKKS